MKKILSLFCAGAFVSALCVGIMACDDKPKEPESIRVKTEFKIINQLEYESDLTVELKSGDGQIITIKPGEEQVVHSYTETCYSKDLAPIASLPYNDPVLSAEMKAYGKIVPNVILEHDRWEFDSEDLSNRKDSDIDYKYTATLTVTNELLSALDGPEPDTYVTENYKIVNRIASDIVVELRFGDGQVTTIRPGEEQMIGSMEYHYEWGVAYSRDRKLLDAEMKIDGDIVPNSVWWHENQDSIRENGEDDYHYTLLYTLTVTDELLERAFAGG